MVPIIGPLILYHYRILTLYEMNLCVTLKSLFLLKKFLFIKKVKNDPTKSPILHNSVILEHSCSGYQESHRFLS
jgi:hypothetical protein